MHSIPISKPKKTQKSIHLSLIFFFPTVSQKTNSSIARLSVSLSLSPPPLFHLHGQVASREKKKKPLVAQLVITRENLIVKIKEMRWINFLKKKKCSSYVISFVFFLVFHFSLSNTSMENYWFWNIWHSSILNYTYECQIISLFFRVNCA